MDIDVDFDLQQLYEKHWKSKKTKFDYSIVERIYEQVLLKYNYTSNLSILESTDYLNVYLMPNLKENSQWKHILSCLLLVNVKCQTESLLLSEAVNGETMITLIKLAKNNIRLSELDERSKCILIRFWKNAFNQLDNVDIRRECFPLVKIGVWTHLSEHRFDLELRKRPELKKAWIKFNNKKGKSELDENWLFEWLADIVSSDVSIEYQEEVVDFLIDLLSQLPTRMFVNVLLDDLAFSALLQDSPLTDRLREVIHYPVDEDQAAGLKQEEVESLHYSRLYDLQKQVFGNDVIKKKIMDFCMKNISQIDIETDFDRLNDKELLMVVKDILMVNMKLIKDPKKNLLLKIIKQKYIKRKQVVGKTYPEDDIMWNKEFLETETWTKPKPLAYPKQGLQYLCLEDYLQRGFHLQLLEFSHELRKDIEDAMQRLGPRVSTNKQKQYTEFTGWSRMAMGLDQLELVRVKRPNVGEEYPAEILLDLHFNVGKYNAQIKQEWDSIRTGDVLFLLSIKAPAHLGSVEFNPDSDNFREFYGIQTVRGCQVVGYCANDGRLVTDEVGKPFIEGEKTGNHLTFDRVLRVSVDPQSPVGEDYLSFNLLLRRKPERNNFKAVLDTIAELLNRGCNIVEWLKDLILGYGSPEKHFLKGETVEFHYTFLNDQHLRETLPEVKIIHPLSANEEFKRELSSKLQLTHGRLWYSVRDNEAFTHFDASSEEYDKLNFTQKQVESIYSGCRQGMTLVVGPPGTGKTDVAAQIILNLYKTGEKIVVIANSNHALNNLFEKLLKKVDGRHLIRLGHGEEDLALTEGDGEFGFGKYGRIQWFLKRKQDLLQKVSELSVTLDRYFGDVGSSCQAAISFFELHLKSLWFRFLDKFYEFDSSKALCDNFPFSKFFSLGCQELALEEAKALVQFHWDSVEQIFKEIQSLQAFEVLKSNYDRSCFILNHEARIVAMTAKHAAIKRHEFQQIGFKFQNILMEEAGQISEIESVIPITSAPDLKRLVMIGDHNQLPPVVRSQALKIECRLDQSLFARLIRLGCPYFQLDAQGRCRSSLRRLFDWKYNHNLSDLPVVTDDPRFSLANPGFTFTHQLIDVEDFQGQGETAPNPHFTQNVGEAEFIVAMFQYMRLLGYPAEKITILTTYNGQRELILDVLKRRCDWNPFFGRPHKVSTVDKYQGRQNDYILLSLVRTRFIGYLKDLRRLVVAMSRARLGLYVFCRQSLMLSSPELRPVFEMLQAQPDGKLSLCVGEEYGQDITRQEGATVKKPKLVEGLQEMGQLVYELTKNIVVGK